MELKNPLPAISGVERSLTCSEIVPDLRPVRFFDLDRPIEAGEHRMAASRRFPCSGAMPEQTAARVDIPPDRRLRYAT